MDGTPFGRYRLIELLGRGGMGEVWRAYDTAANNRVVAIKLLPPHLASDSTFMTRFRREADAAAQLNNPHIIPIHNYGEIDGRLYVDMRLVEGRDLEAVLAGGPMDPGRAARIIEQVAKALQAAHKIGLVHRDVKPSNILLDADDFAYLIDFGIARGADETSLTATGGVIGSWHYMAPERMRAHEADARADIYALACVLYECLTGHRPFPGDSVESQVAAHLTDPPPQPSTTRPTVPAGFDAVIAKGMAKNPDERYATTVELARDALEAITVPIPRPAPSPAPNPPTQLAPNRVTAEPTIVEGESSKPPPSTSPAAATQHRPEQLPASGEELGAAATEHADWTNQPPTQLAPAGAARPPQPATPTETEDRRLSRRTKITLIAGAVVLVAVIAAAIGIPALIGHQPSPSSQSSPSSPSTQTAQPSSYGSQVVLPFTDFPYPEGVAVDAAGSVYLSGPVTTTQTGRVVKLAAGATTETELPFTGLKEPYGVAVDSAGSVYVADSGNNRVLKLPAGANTPTPLPFTGLLAPYSVAVNSAGDVYVTDHGNKRVLMLAAGSTTQTVLPFGALNYLDDVAADSAGNVYITDHGNDRVLMLAVGAAAPKVLPFSGLSFLISVAVDARGSVYVTEGGRVLMLAAGTTTQTELPFTGLSEPGSVAVDSAGSVYVVDTGSHRVVKLPRAPS